MKLGSLTKLVASLLASAALFSSYANAGLLPIDGQIDFSGIVTGNGGPGNLVGSSQITVAFSGTDYTFGTYNSNLEAVGGVALGTAPTFINPLDVNPIEATIPFQLWSVTSAGVTYTFSATSETVTTTGVAGPGPQSMSISGSGLASISGGVYGPTTGNWSIAITDSGGQQTAVFGFGSDNNVAPTPDSGSSVMLSIIGLLGIGLGLMAQRRKLVQA